MLLNRLRSRCRLTGERRTISPTCCWTISATILVACAPLVVRSAEPQTQRYRYSQVQMGVPVELILYAPSQQAANAAVDAAFARIKELNAVMSDYDPTSELSRLSDSAGQNRGVHVSRDLWLVLKRAQDLSARTEGAFDITVGPY